jgi:RNA 3'-terminal phosphate cyclase (ATP)
MAGFGFAAQGEVLLEIEPSQTHALHWMSRGRTQLVAGVFSYSGLSDSILERGVDHAERMAKALGIDLEIETCEVESRNTGIHLTLWANYENGLGGATMMGARGLRVETLVQTTFERLTEWMASPATIDSYLADQMLLPAVVAEGPTKVKVSEVTRRLKTMIWVIKQFMPIHITLVGDEGMPGELTIHREA